MAANGLKPSAGQTRGKGDPVLLGNPDVEGAVGKFLGEQVEPCSRRHGGRDRHDPVVLASLSISASANTRV